MIVLVVLLEVSWAVWYLTKGQAPKAVAEADLVNSTLNTITLTSTSNNLKLGESVKVNINVSSEKMVDGVDVIVFYDPNLLMVEENTAAKKPVTPGSMFTDYPVNEVDQVKGRIGFSGIGSETKGIVAKGVMGTVNFKAKAAGKAVITVDFKKKSTVDSNIIETKTSKDIIDGVSGLEINIAQ